MSEVQAGRELDALVAEMVMSESAEVLRARIAGLRAGEDRMDQLDWMGRQWVASMMADACIIAEALEARLDAEQNQSQAPNRPLTAPAAHGSREKGPEGTETGKGRSGAVSE